MQRSSAFGSQPRVNKLEKQKEIEDKGGKSGMILKAKGSRLSVGITYAE